MKQILLLYRALNKGSDIFSAKQRGSQGKNFFSKIEKNFFKTKLAKKIFDFLILLLQNLLYLLLGFWFALQFTNYLNLGVPISLVLAIAPIFWLLFSLSFGLMGTKEGLFNNKDNDYLMALPFTTGQILLARFLQIFSSFFISFFVMHVAMTVTFVFFTPLPMHLLLIYLIVPMLLAFGLVLLTAIVLFPIYYLFQKWKKVKLLDGIFSIFIILGIVGVQIVLNVNLGEAQNNHGHLVKILANFVEIIEKVYPVYSLYVEALFAVSLVDALLPLALLCTVLVFLTCVLYLVASKMYFPILSQLGAVEKLSQKDLDKEKTKAKKEANKQTQKNVLPLGLKKFLLLSSASNKMFRDSFTFVFNHYLLPWLMPVIVLGSGLYGFFKGGGNAEKLQTLSEMVSELMEKLTWLEHMETVQAMAVLTFICLLFFFRTQADIYIFSKDGKAYGYLQALPLTAYEIYFSHVQFLFWHQIYTQILYLAAVLFLFLSTAYKLAWLALAIWAVTFLTFVFVTPLLDLWKPFFDFSNEQELFKKRNLVSFLSLLSYLAVMALPILASILYLFADDLPFALPVPFFPLLMSLIFVILIVEVLIVKTFLVKRVKKAV